MTRPRVFVTRLLAGPVMARLHEVYDLTQRSGESAPDRRTLLEGIRTADAVICTLTERIDEQMLQEAPRLKVVANYAVGYNNIDLDAARRRGIVVTNTPDVLTDATADLTWALLCAVARRVPEGHALVQGGGWTGWTPTELLGSDISGQTLGIVGMGRIGRGVAERARGFRMRVLYTGGSSAPVPADPLWRQTALVDLLRGSDFVSLHVPLTAATHHLIGRHELSLMRTTAYLINTSRGPVVDEAALVEALQGDRLAGAALDVYENEPTVHDGLRSCSKVVTLPHLGSATLHTRIRMGLVCLANIDAVLQGNPAPNRVV
ncbi:D-glycerate dehydrogenase [Nitrospira sp.]|nr:D-glycerate dehydrogenase [Nitrospira sp.]